MEKEQAKDLLLARWKQEHQEVAEHQESGTQDWRKMADDQVVIWFGNH